MVDKNARLTKDHWNEMVISGLERNVSDPDQRSIKDLSNKCTFSHSIMNGKKRKKLMIEIVEDNNVSTVDLKLCQKMLKWDLL